MKKILISNIFRDDIFQLGVIINIMINIALWVFLYGRVKPASDPITLQYNIYFGISYMGEWYKIFVMPIIGLLIFLLNYILSYYIYRNDTIAAYFLMVSAVAIQALLLLSAHLITVYT